MNIVVDECVERPIVVRLRETPKQILEKHPELTPKTLKAAFDFAIESVQFDHVTPRDNGFHEEG